MKKIYFCLLFLAILNFVSAQNPNRSILEDSNARTDRASFGEGKTGDELYEESKIAERHHGYETAIGNREGQVDEQGFSLDSKSSLENENWFLKNYEKIIIVILFLIILFLISKKKKFRDYK